MKYAAKKVDEMETLFRIGEFADMFHVSVRALRLYDKMGLLAPGYIDGTPVTGIIPQNKWRFSIQSWS